MIEQIRFKINNTCCTNYIDTYYKQIMQDQDSYCLDSPLYDNTSFIPSNYNYLNFKLTSEEENLSIPYGLYIVPFQTHQITLAHLLQSLLQRLGLSSKDLLEKIRLTLLSETMISQKTTLEDLRLTLCRQSASGITLQAKIMSKIFDQAAAKYYISNEPDFNHSKINKWFLLINNQEPFYISINKDIKFSQLQKVICAALNQYYNNNISSDLLLFYKISKTEAQLVFEWEKEKKISKEQVTRSILEAEHDIIGVEVIKEGAEWPSSEVSSEEYLIFHVTNAKKIKIKFSLIAKYKVGQLLKYLKIEHSNSLGIKIVNQIFPPWKLVKDAAKYFQKCEGKFVKNVECRLVSEKEMFFNSMKKLNGDFEIQKEMIPMTKYKDFDKCRDLAQRRSRQFQEAKLNHFTNEKQISPITFYTSSVEVIDHKSFSSKLLYRSLNDYLRATAFGLADNYQDEWRYQFSATLMRSIYKIQQYNVVNKETNKVTVYRGIRGHQLVGEQGQLYVSKQFLSTSANKTKAQSFANNSPIGSILEIQCLTGRSISNFSIYGKEEQVLFMPYTYFRIQKKDTSSPIFYIKLVELQEKKFKCNPTTQILWVDDKLKQGAMVISTLQCPMHTTFIRQLISTSALDQWIQSNKQVINNPSIKKAVVTNMRRTENGKEVLDAGAKTVKLVRQKIPNCEIVCYIGNIRGTEIALSNNGIDPSSIKIFNKRPQLKEFIASICAPTEEVQQIEEVIQQTNKSILNFFSSIQSKIIIEEKPSSQKSV